VIEDISRKRQAYSTKEAIYFITPTQANIEYFVNDYANGKITYAAAHLFFTCGSQASFQRPLANMLGLSDELFAMIKNSPASQYIKTLKEIYVDFIGSSQG
jgi:syntaxin-binding protein 1